jgi:replicative DNA helicase
MHTDVDCGALLEEGSKAIMGGTAGAKELFWQERVSEEIDSILAGRIKKRYYELSGLHKLDSELGGVFPGDMVVIASETSRGKTALSLQIAGHMALDEQDLKIALFSFEMNAHQITERIISNRSEVRLSAMRYCEMNDRDIEKLKSFKQNTPPGRTIIIEDSFALTVEGVLSRCRRLKNNGELHAVVVDYLQLVNPTNTKSQNRQTDVQEISRNLKLLAGRLGVVVIALSQVNDLGQMRESRAISHDADIILQIRDNDDASGTSEREIEILKNRNGPRGKTVKLHFYGDYTSFSDD